MPEGLPGLCTVRFPSTEEASFTGYVWWPAFGAWLSERRHVFSWFMRHLRQAGWLAGWLVEKRWVHLNEAHPNLTYKKMNHSHRVGVHQAPMCLTKKSTCVVLNLNKFFHSWNNLLLVLHEVLVWENDGRHPVTIITDLWKPRKCQIYSPCLWMKVVLIAERDPHFSCFDCSLVDWC